MKSVLSKLCVVGILLLTISLSESYSATTYDLLRIDPNVRNSALGSFPIALSKDDLGSLASNVAGMASLSSEQVNISYTNYPLDLASGNVVYGKPVRNGFGALSATYFTYGTFDKIPEVDGPANGEFSANDIMITAGYARPFKHNLCLGAAAKLIYSKIDEYSSTGMAVDVSGMWHWAENKADFAIGIYNMGAQLSTYNGVDEDLPTILRAGAAKKLEHLPLRITATAHYELEGDFFATGAGEFTVSPLLKLRAGYTTRAPDYHVGGSDDGVAGFSAGIGLTHLNYRFDYAFNSQGALGQIHRAGLTLLR
jgi:hypothetical protein